MANEPLADNAALTIGFVLDDGLDKPDGVQQHILTLGRWFSSQGHSVHYLVGETRRSDIPNVHVMSRNLRVRFNGNLLSSPLPAKMARIREVLENIDFDVLHVQTPYSPFMAARIIRSAHPRTVLVGTFHILPVGRMQYWLTRCLGLWLQSSLKKFDVFFSVSKPAAEFAKKTFGIVSAVLPNPVNLSLFSAQAGKKKTSAKVQIVFLGRLVKRKGCYELLKAINHLAKHERIEGTIEVHICGSGPDQRKLEAYVAQHNLARTVVFHGFVSESEKIAHLQSADIAVFPSLYGESFGIVLVEAMAAGANVVVGGNNPGYKSVFFDMPEALCDAADTKGLAHLLRTYIQNPQARRKLHTQQQKLVKNFSVEAIGKKLLNTYTDCINQRKSG